MTFRQQEIRCLVSKQTRHPPLFPRRDGVHRSLSNLLPRWSSQQFQKIQRSSCRKRHGQLILVLDLGLRPNDHNRHRARCRSSASTSDEHVSLCASRAGRQRPRQLRFRSDGHHLVYRTLQRRPGERAAFLRCAATASSARRCRAISSRAPPPTPHTSAISTSTYGDQGHPHYLGRDCEIIRAELTIGAVRSWQASHAR